MASDYIFLIDSGCDLSPEYMAENQEHGLRMVHIGFTIDGKSYPDASGNILDNLTLYERLRSGAVSTTAMTATGTFEHLFETHLGNGYDLIFLSLSSGLSGTYQSAVAAAAEIGPKFPDRKLILVDSMCATIGIGLLVNSALQMKKAGKGIEEVRDFLEANKMRVNHLFTVTDLMFLQRGGRVGSISAIMGTLLGVQPMLDVDKEGKLRACSKKRGRRQALLGLVDWMDTLLTEPGPFTFSISHGDSEADCNFVINEIKKRHPGSEALTALIGPVIGSHSGPGTIALFFYGKERTT